MTMHQTCSDELQALPAAGCDGQPLVSDHLADALPNAGMSEQAKLQMYKIQLDHLLANTTPATLADPTLFLVCDTDEEAAYMRLLLDARGLAQVGVRVKVKWTAAMSRAKEAAGRAQQPRHAAAYTKSQPSAQARKKARRKAKAGRKASR